MSDLHLRIVHLEDDPADHQLVLHELRKAGYCPECTAAEDEAGFTAALAANPDVILCDWNLPGFDAPRALEIVSERCPDIPVLVVSGSIGEESAVRAIKLGATDYLLKDRLGRLGQAVKQALVQRDLRDAERRARDEVRASEARYRALADGIPQIVWTARPDGANEYFNRHAADYTGIQPEDLAGWRWERICHPEDRTVTLNAWAAIRQTGTPRDVEFRLRRWDGEYRWHVCRQVALRGPTGAVVQWIGTCTDIHDQKAAAESQARDAQILAGVRDAVIVTDLGGVVTYWNEGATALFGWTAEEMIGRPYADRFPPSVREEIARQIQERVGGTDWRGEYEDFKKDGSRVWVDARVRRYDRADGTPAGILGVSHDITERKRLEEQFRHAQKMEAVGRLAGGVAHDFNNLLTVINGYADLYLPKTPEGHPHRAALTAIRDAGERASALTSQLLAFSRKAIVSPRVLDLNDVVTQAERLLRRLIGEDIRLATVLVPTGCLVEADPNQLDQVIMNLAVNARDAMPTGGSLTIETRRTQLAVSTATEAGDVPPGSYVELVVRDNGCGMSCETKRRLFEPFFTTKDPGKGTGLGLAVVHGVVKQAGGHVSVESAVGAGTTFRILFPEAAAPPPKPSSGSACVSRRGSETILLVEDEDSVRTLCRIALETQGYKVITAGCGQEALRVIAGRAEPVRLLVTDVVMPGMSGRELVVAARASLTDLRVLYVSGYTDDSVLRHGIKDDTDAFLQKPFTPLGLTRKVRAVLDATG